MKLKDYQHSTYTMATPWKKRSSKKTIDEINVNTVSMNENLTTGLEVYKVKADDDGALLMKASIAPYGNKHRESKDIKSCSATFRPTGIRILLSFASVMKRLLAKIDFTSSFSQIGEAERNVCVVPPRECGGRSKS